MADRQEKLMERFNNLLDKIEGDRRRTQVNNLVSFLKENSDYFKAPASPGAYHLNRVCGLLEHSINVAENALKINIALDANLDESELIIAALFHDLGKGYRDDKNPYYLVNEPTEKQKQYGYVQDKPYKYNEEPCVFMTVPQRAVRVLTRFVEISDQCYQSILIHDGAYVPENEAYKCKESPMALILHSADAWSGFILEPRYEKNSDGKSYVEKYHDKVGLQGAEIKESKVN